MMLRDTEQFLLRGGCKRVQTSLAGISVFIGFDHNDSYAIALCPPEITQTLSSWQLMNMHYDLNRTLLTDQVLFLIFSENVSRTVQALNGDRAHWIYDLMTGRLLIPEGQPTEYHLLKEAVLTAGRVNPPIAGGVGQDIRQNGRNYQQNTTTAGYGGQGNRTGGRSNRARNKLLSITNLFVLLNILVFVIGEYVKHRTGSDLFTEYGALYTRAGTDGQIYRFLTSTFLHANFRHLAGNMIALLFLGENLERVVGRWKFAVIYLGGGLIAGIVAYAQYYLSYDYPISLVGASGAIFAVMGAFLYILICNIRNISKATLWRLILYIGLSIYMGATTQGVSLSAHLGGLVGGFILAIILYRKGEVHS